VTQTTGDPMKMLDEKHGGIGKIVVLSVVLVLCATVVSARERVGCANSVLHTRKKLRQKERSVCHGKRKSILPGWSQKLGEVQNIARIDEREQEVVHRCQSGTVLHPQEVER